MAINFPDNPTVGQSFTSANRTWTYNGSAWVGDYSSTGSADFLDGIDSSQFLRSDTSDTMTGTLTVTGNVGVGTTNAGYKLDVFNSSSDAGSQIRVKNTYASINAHATVNIDGYGSSTLKLWRNGVEEWKLERLVNTDDLQLNAYGGAVSGGAGVGVVQHWDYDTGYIGIGVTTPQNLLDIANRNTNDHIKLRALTVAEGQQAAGTGISWTWDNSGTWAEEWAAVRAIFPGAGNSHLTFSTKPGGTAMTEKVRILDNGNVGIGTTNPTTKLQVNGTITATSYAGDGSNLTGISAGATGGGTDQVFYENDITVNSSYTITTGKNAMTAGPVEIANGATVTIPSGSNWTIV